MNKDLDINFYKYVYDDVKHITKNKDLIFHYNNYGIKECRIPNKQFFYEKFKYAPKQSINLKIGFINNRVIEEQNYF